MSEADWLACKSPEDLLYYATYGHDPPSADAPFRLYLDVDCPAGHVRPTPRQLALAVVGWAELGRGAAHDEATARAVRLLVAGADGAVGPEAVSEFRARPPEPGCPGYDVWVYAPFILWEAEAGPLPVEAVEGIADVLSPLIPPADQCAVLRDVLGNPFRRATADPAWLNSTVVQLASGIYVEGAFDRLPILADALEEAGCDDQALLEHLRGPGPHVRGCWALDLLLARE
jgi:hypothetical protein